MAKIGAACHSKGQAEALTQLCCVVRAWEFLVQTIEYEIGVVLVELEGDELVFVQCGEWVCFVAGGFFNARAFTPSFTPRKQFQSFVLFLIDKTDLHLISNCKN